MFRIKIIVLLLFTDTIQSNQPVPSSPRTDCGLAIIKPIKTFNVFTSETYHGEFPWHVAIYRRQKYGSRTFICSGVLLNRNTAVTTAHCLYGDYGIIPSALLIISLGKYDIDISTLHTEELHVAETIIYEKFDRFNLEHDIALIKMSSNTTNTNYIQPICLTNRTPDGIIINGIVIGWGHNKLSAKANLLAKGKIVLQVADDCHHNHMDLFENLLDATKMCGKYAIGTELCAGDSGSGLFYEENGRWFLRGIFSFGVTLSHHKHCDSAQLILFTNVLSYFDWIVENM